MIEYVFFFKYRENFIFDVEKKHVNALRLRDFVKFIEYGIMVMFGAL